MTPLRHLTRDLRVSYSDLVSALLAAPLAVVGIGWLCLWLGVAG